MILTYGPSKDVNVHISWSTVMNEFRVTFSAINMTGNAHTLMTDQLQSHLNRTHNLTEFIHILHETYHPLSSVVQLPMLLQLGVLVSVN